MKRVGRLWARVIAWENLLLALHKAARGKRKLPTVQRFLFNQEAELFALQQLLSAGSWQSGGYTLFTIYDRKPRSIAAAPFRDRVVHHAVMNVIEPLLDKRFIYDSYASRANKGVHAAVNRYQHYARRNSHVMCLDISKYFASIDRRILKGALASRIKDTRLLALLDNIIDGGPVQPFDGCIYPDENLFSASQRQTGIPIGNLTSQFFANLYLDDFDHWLKENRRVPGYIRYVDDFFIFGRDRQYLLDIKHDIDAYLAGIHLRCHIDKIQIRPCRERIDVLGYVVSPQRRWLRNENGYRARRRMREITRMFRQREIEWVQLHSRIRCWIGHAQHGETLGLRKNLFSELYFKREHRQDESACVARRLVEQQTEEVAFRQPQQERSR